MALHIKRTWHECRDRYTRWRLHRIVREDDASVSLYCHRVALLAYEMEHQSLASDVERADGGPASVRSQARMRELEERMVFPRALVDAANTRSAAYTRLCALMRSPGSHTPSDDAELASIRVRAKTHALE